MVHSKGKVKHDQRKRTLLATPPNTSHDATRCGTYIILIRWISLCKHSFFKRYKRRQQTVLLIRAVEASGSKREAQLNSKWLPSQTHQDLQWSICVTNVEKVLHKNVTCCVMFAHSMEVFGDVLDAHQLSIVRPIISTIREFVNFKLVVRDLRKHRLVVVYQNNREEYFRQRLTCTGTHDGSIYG